MYVREDNILYYQHIREVICFFGLSFSIILLHKNVSYRRGGAGKRSRLITVRRARKRLRAISRTRLERDPPPGDLVSGSIPDGRGKWHPYPAKLLSSSSTMQPKACLPVMHCVVVPVSRNPLFPATRRRRLRRDRLAVASLR